MKSVGIALGGGGARGLAHPVILEALDELGVRPALVSGASIGSVVGALYASGISGREIREAFEEVLVPKSARARHWVQTQMRAWSSYFAVDLTGKGLLRPHRFLSDLAGRIGVTTFEELVMPLRVVATDFWTWEPVVFEAGDLIHAVHASIAVPGVFQPVVAEAEDEAGKGARGKAAGDGAEDVGASAERIFIDGGVVNPVPWDLLEGRCDLTIAVDVTGRRTIPPAREQRVPQPHDALFAAIQIMQGTMIRDRLRSHPPDLYLRPDLVDVRILEFDKAEQVFAQAAPAKEELKRELGRLLEESDRAR